MNTFQQNDLYYDSNPQRSPRSNQYSTQSLHRQQSRHFDPFGQTFGLDEQTSRYDSNRYSDRMNANMQNNYAGFDMGVPPAWNSPAYGHNSLAGIGATTRVRPPAARGRIPSGWMDQPQHLQMSTGFPAIGPSPIGLPQARQEPMGNENEDDLIPTAIVIKNIPFAVKKEQLVQVMTDLCLPLPYAFNYHFDNGVFRGLAFANFTTAEETATVIQAMNHLELHGRKLRVEYKKMLPQAERDRIEREKRERRGQLEEQHRPMAQSQLQPQSSTSTLNARLTANSPSPVNGRASHPMLDYNDPTTLNYYSKLILFKSDVNQGDVYSFPPDVPPEHRTIIHGLAQNLSLGHESTGEGSHRQIHVFRNTSNSNGISPISAATNHHPFDPSRRGLYRAATTDFSDVRDPAMHATIRGQSSAVFSGYDNPYGGLSAGANLRSAKSFADLRSYTPSPAQSAASFPAGLTGNLGRVPEYGHGPSSPGSSRSNITPTTTTTGPSHDAMLANGLSNMNLNSGFGPTGGSPHRLRNIASWDREPSGPAPGPIGSHRTFSGNPEDSGRNRNQAAVARQTRVIMPERAPGFPRPRQNGHQSRGSDELSSHEGAGMIQE